MLDADKLQIFRNKNTTTKKINIRWKDYIYDKQFCDEMLFVILLVDFGKTCLFRACNKQPNVPSSESVNQPT